MIPLLPLAPLWAEYPPEKEGINYISKELSFVEETDQPVLLPLFEGAEEIRAGLRSQKPSGIVELLYTMPLPPIDQEYRQLSILQALSQISTLQGIEYFSGSRQAMYLYLEEAYVVEDTKKKQKKPIADPVFDSLPSGAVSLAVYQRDTTFGDIWYNTTFQVTKDAVLLSMVNKSTIWIKKIYPAMSEGRLIINVVVIPQKEELVFYALASYRLGFTFGIDLSLGESFDHRVSALQGWFARQIYPDLQ